MHPGRVHPREPAQEGCTRHAPTQGYTPVNPAQEGLHPPCTHAGGVHPREPAQGGGAPAMHPRRGGTPP